jgi:hypothetical protein
MMIEILYRIPAFSNQSQGSECSNYYREDCGHEDSSTCSSFVPKFSAVVQWSVDRLAWALESSD